VKADTVRIIAVQLDLLIFLKSQEDQYAKWMAAFRLASKGKTMADASYDTEVQSLIAFLNMQHPAPAPALNPSQVDLQPEDFVAPCFLKKLKAKQVSQELSQDSKIAVMDIFRLRKESWRLMLTCVK
jgi:hypothetical protein